MSLEKLKSEKIILENRLARLEAQENHRFLKEKQRLQILIGKAYLAELDLLAISDTQAYELEKQRLQQMLNKHVHRVRDRDFLIDLDLIAKG